MFFLPPMVPDPSADFTAESFVGDLDVVIKVCIWNTELDACISPVLERYDRNSGSGSETVRVPDGEEYYLVNWHMDDVLDIYTLGEGEVFRIVVEVDERILAFADVEVVATGQDLKEVRNAKTGEVIPLLDGRTLTIRVRIEEGWEEYRAVLAALEGGGGHTCVLTTDGTAYCWGYGQYGQLGDGTFYNTPPYGMTSPVAVDQSVSGLFATLAAGGYHNCGLTVDGAAYCWGRNDFGQLGTGSSGYHSNVPIPIDQSLSGAFASLAGGNFHTCGLTTDGMAFCWGNNWNGQLGNGTFNSTYYPYGVNTPVAVDQSLSGPFASLTAGIYHTCGLTADGSAYCWGRGPQGQLGDGNFYTAPAFGATSPVAVDESLSGPFASLTGGLYQTCGLTADGTAYCWGFGIALGNGSGATSPVPSAVDQSVSGTFGTLTAGVYHTCGLTPAGWAYCWGIGTRGQLGDGNTHTTYPYGALSPVAVDQSLSGAFVSLAAGSVHTCGLSADRRAHCWGWNYYGQLGNGSTADMPTPDLVLVPPDGW